MSRARDISICLVAFENQKAHPDLSHDSGFWLRVKAADASPFLTAFKSSPDVFHDFMIEQRVGKEIRRSTLSAQIVKIEEGPAETRVLIRPHPSLGLDDTQWLG
jgi:hypothetical protein